ncbi:MAG: hypothetical protein ABI743_00940, partial [bacterium]
DEIAGRNTPWPSYLLLNSHPELVTLGSWRLTQGAEIGLPGLKGNTGVPERTSAIPSSTH